MLVRSRSETWQPKSFRAKCLCTLALGPAESPVGLFWGGGAGLDSVVSGRIRRFGPPGPFGGGGVGGGNCTEGPRSVRFWGFGRAAQRATAVRQLCASCAPTLRHSWRHSRRHNWRTVGAQLAHSWRTAGAHPNGPLRLPENPGFRGCDSQMCQQGGFRGSLRRERPGGTKTPQKKTGPGTPCWCDGVQRAGHFGYVKQRCQCLVLFDPS